MGEETAIAYQAARENFEALMEGLGHTDVEMMPFEYTDAERCVMGCETGRKNGRGMFGWGFGSLSIETNCLFISKCVLDVIIPVFWGYVSDLELVKGHNSEGTGGDGGPLPLAFLWPIPVSSCVMNSRYM